MYEYEAFRWDLLDNLRRAARDKFYEFSNAGDKTGWEAVRVRQQAFADFCGCRDYTSVINHSESLKSLFEALVGPYGAVIYRVQKLKQKNCNQLGS